MAFLGCDVVLRFAEDMRAMHMIESLPILLMLLGMHVLLLGVIK